MSIFTLAHGYKLPISKEMARVFAVLTMLVLIMLGAYVRIPLPFTPVPITLQTFFVILGASILGRKLSLLATGSYLILGIFGLPVFQGYNAGITYLFGPTGGYLMGFMAASLVVGHLMDIRQRSFVSTISILALGQALIYLFGISWLAFLLKISIPEALYLGMIPFLPGAACKLISASVVHKKIGARIKSSI